jgi:oxygen-dependent protoporphyrinogen oxidase
VAIGGAEPGALTAQAVIVATPADQAARILASVIPPVASALREIPYASCALVTLAYDRRQIGRKLNGYGFVVPRTENRLILSCSFSSLKYPRRAPEGTLLVRVVIGGTQQSHLLHLSNDELAELAQLELAHLLGARGNPRMSDVTRRWRVMPQYLVGHCARRDAIDAHLEHFPTLALAGSALRGVGVPHCIQGGEQAASRVLRALHSQQEMAFT